MIAVWQSSDNVEKLLLFLNIDTFLDVAILSLMSIHNHVVAILVLLLLLLYMRMLPVLFEDDDIDTGCGIVES